MTRQEAARWRHENKTSVMGMVERGGRVRAFVIPDRTAPTLMGKVREHVLPESMVFTDEFRLYSRLGREYKEHHRINHRAKVYVSGDVLRGGHSSLSGLGSGGPDDNDAQAGRLVIAASLSHGSNPNSNAAGRRREDDVNLVAGPLGGGNDGIGRRTEDDPNLVAGSAVRRLTPTECERLQALPDGWTQLGGTTASKRYAAIGDAVTASVAEWIGERIKGAT